MRRKNNYNNMLHCTTLMDYQLYKDRDKGLPNSKQNLIKD